MLKYSHITHTGNKIHSLKTHFQSHLTSLKRCCQLKHCKLQYFISLDLQNGNNAKKANIHSLLTFIIQFYYLVYCLAGTVSFCSHSFSRLLQNLISDCTGWCSLRLTAFNGIFFGCQITSIDLRICHSGMLFY